MGFKKLVSLACDGPCGTVLPATEKAPVGWSKFMLTLYEKLETGQKPTIPARYGYLCPVCTDRFTQVFETAHFSFQSKQQEGA